MYLWIILLLIIDIKILLIKDIKILLGIKLFTSILYLHILHNFYVITVP